MYSELINIIFGFYLAIFENRPTITYSQFSTALWSNFGAEDYWQAVRFTLSNAGLNGLSQSYGFVAFILTFITLIILLVLLFKLFKWLFTLIFKLFRLN